MTEFMAFFLLLSFNSVILARSLSSKEVAGAEEVFQTGWEMKASREVVQSWGKMWLWPWRAFKARCKRVVYSMRTSSPDKESFGDKLL